MLCLKTKQTIYNKYKNYRGVVTFQRLCIQASFYKSSYIGVVLQEQGGLAHQDQFLRQNGALSANG